MTATRFRMLPQFQDWPKPELFSGRGHISRRSAQHFPGDSLHERFARELGETRAVRFKEVLEAIEFFAAVRKRNRARTVIDLCAGHGMVGILFAMYEREVERVILIERNPPKNRVHVIAAALKVAPWIKDKLELIDSRIQTVATDVAERHPGAAVVAVHACGPLTDRAIALGIELGGPIALMPCCRPHSKCPAPPAVKLRYGADEAFDIDRTYRMEAAGLQVRWTEVPAEITPMNRVLQATPRS